ncbi:DUF2850 domain-containing protein [Vibrio aestuarianus]|uniref:DUF2850 domain-containing protein n=1 Tax=Vibrio aestuarianus TaxID=28171 RepID=UPI00237CB9DD|nr:DUF2850 domain-containing protein [Vibrio aestuarianus]MDE1331015.1 DUF2850 domain-containing protein [Vibrio aestuarianus]
MIKDQTIELVTQGTHLRKRTVIERVLIVLALVGTVAVFSLYSDIFSRISDYLTPKEQVYGIWVEQNVAPYVAKHIELSQQGVMSGGRVLATSFDFDGHYLEYQIGDEHYRYKILNESYSEMTLVSSEHYNPTFQLSGKHKKNLR